MDSPKRIWVTTTGGGPGGVWYESLSEYQTRRRYQEYIRSDLIPWERIEKALVPNIHGMRDCHEAFNIISDILSIREEDR